MNNVKKMWHLPVTSKHFSVKNGLKGLVLFLIADHNNTFLHEYENSKSNGER